MEKISAQELPKQNTIHGFTLVEIIVAISILTLISLASGAALFPMYFKYKLQYHVDQTYGIFSLAQQSSIAVNRGLEYGINIDNNSKTISIIPEGKSYKLPPIVELSTHPGLNEIRFAKRTGFPLDTPNSNFTLVIKSRNFESGILVEPNGLISKLPIRSL